MARKKKENLVHLDLQTLSEEVKEKTPTKGTDDENQTLGELLRRTREKKRYHLETIAKRLKIKPIYLEALEKGHYYAFPGLVYGIGFLRSYAQFLGLDVKNVMDQFHAETSGIKAQPLEMPIPENKNIVPSGRTVFKSILFLIIVYLLWYIMNSFLQPTIQTPDTILTPIVENVENTVVEQPTETSVVPTKEVAKEKTVKNTEQKVDLQTPKKTEPVAEPVRKPIVYGLPKQEVLSFVATDKTWIEVVDTDTDKVVLSEILYAGDSYNPPEDSDDYILKTDNAGALDGYIGSKKVATLGKKEESKSDFPLTKRALRKL